MMNRGQADIVVSDLAKELGIPGLALDEDGFGLLAIDEGRVIVAIGHNAARGSIDLMACLDTVDPTPARISRALAANFTLDPDGPVLAADPSTGAFVLQQRVVRTDLPDGGFPGVVARFVEHAETWAERLAGNGGESSPTQRGSEELYPSSLGVRA